MKRRMHKNSLKAYAELHLERVERVALLTYRLYQRIRAVIEIETAITNARELRTRMANSDGDIDDKSNGTFVSRYVIEDALCKLQRRLIDSTVEKFWGVE